MPYDLSVCLSVLIMTVNFAKMAEPIQIPFWETHVDPISHVLDGVLHIGATWQIRLKDPCSVAMRADAVAIFTLATCFTTATTTFHFYNTTQYNKKSYMLMTVLMLCFNSDKLTSNKIKRKGKKQEAQPSQRKYAMLRQTDALNNPIKVHSHRILCRSAPYGAASRHINTGCVTVCVALHCGTVR